MNTNGWEALAAWYDEKQGDRGDLWHRTLIDPVLLNIAGSVAGLRVLDLACGNGYLTRRFARAGAVVTGVDGSAAMIARARHRESQDPLGIMYHTCDAARLPMFEDASVDVVVCNMGLMNIEDAAGALRETSRVLSSHGRLIASLSHPCFDIPGASAWVVETTDLTTAVWRKVGRYRETFVETVPWHVGEHATVGTPAYHRPLSWYVRAMRAAGLALTAFEEPEPTEAFSAAAPQGSWIAQIPLHCVIEAHKAP